MSGVFGVVDPGRQIDVRSVADKMAASMCHRDWFVADSYVDDERSLALGRIGIGVFNATPQPVWNSTRTVALVMAGEFYNRDALVEIADAESDAELVLALYERLGDKFVGRLSGAFVVAIWDKTRGLLLIANDRFGLCPAYYAHYKGRLIFSPEMKGVLCGPGFHKELDLTALAEYARFQHLLGDKTFFEGLKLLPNASLLRYDVETGRLTVQPYWDFSQIPQLPASVTFDEAVEEAGRLLKASVNRLTEGDHRIGVYLSGGVDSRIILGLIDKARFPITSITYGQRGCRDAVYAQRIASKVGTQHHYFEFPDGRWVEDFVDLHLELTEGFHSWIHGHGISILDQVRSLIDVNLTGFGGGQI